jgi:tetratricopeptide (TPR) repeat protein
MLASVYYNLGNAYYAKGHLDKAISDYIKAIEINPKHVGVYNNRAITHYFKGEHDKAWEDVYKAQKLGYQVHPGFLKALREVSGRQR